MRQCNNTGDCLNYHTHEYTLTDCYPINDTQHTEHWECRLDGDSYTITEYCELNQECKCGRTLYTCGCNAVDGHHCANIVPTEGLLCESCARNCDQIKDDEPQATYCQHCGSVMHNTDQCPVEMWVCGCTCGCMTEVLNFGEVCSDCVNQIHGTGLKPGLTASSCECCRSYMIGPEGGYCENCTELACYQNHNACGNCYCDNCVYGSDLTYPCYCDMCNCSQTVSTQYEVCQYCQEGQHNQEPEATSCQYCGEAHQAESPDQCPNMIFCGYNTHDEWYLKGQGCSQCMNGDAGEGPWECPYCYTVYDNYEDFRTCKVMTTCPGSGPEAT